MNYINLGLGNQLQELNNIEAERRARRAAEGAELVPPPNQLQVATGRALVSIGSRLMGEPNPTDRRGTRLVSAAR